MKLNRRQFSAALLVLSATPVWAQPAQKPGIAAHEPTELAWILAGLSGLARGEEALNRDTDYWRAAETWFGPFADHSVLAALGDEFNLPRLIGNAANYEFDQQGQLFRTPGSRPMWDDGAGDLFTLYLEAITDFACRSQARAFLAGQAAVLEAVRKNYANAVDLADMQAWLKTEFYARPGPMQVYVSPVTGGWNFTNLDPVAPRLWVPAANPPASDYERYVIARGVFTEMDHNYVNPLTASLDVGAYSFVTAVNGWATEQAWESYNSAELVANEYMTFAAFLAYARDRLIGEELTRIQDSTHRMMERRGFSKFTAFSDELDQQRRAAGTRLEQLYPSVLRTLRK